MAKQKSKKEIATDIANTSISVYQELNKHKKMNRDNLVSALVFIQKAEEILKQKYK